MPLKCLKSRQIYILAPFMQILTNEYIVVDTFKKYYFKLILTVLYMYVEGHEVLALKDKHQRKHEC